MNQKAKEAREQSANELQKGLMDSEAGAMAYATKSFMFSPIAFSVAMIDFIRGFIFNILRVSCVPAELMVRRNFGERHFNLYLYFGGVMWLWIWAMGIISFGSTSADPLISNAAIFSVVGVVFFAKMAWYLFLRRTFSKVDHNHYSYYDGDVLPFLYKLPFSTDSQGIPQESIVRQVHEPLFIFVIGGLVSLILNPQTGAWLMVSAVGMAVKMYAQVQHDRNEILDQIDAEILAYGMPNAMNAKLAKDNNGVYIAGLPREGAFRDKFKEVVANKLRKERTHTAASATHPASPIATRATTREPVEA